MIQRVINRQREKEKRKSTIVILDISRNHRPEAAAGGYLYQQQKQIAAKMHPNLESYDSECQSGTRADSEIWKTCRVRFDRTNRSV
jgi:hypothetical protein